MLSLRISAFWSKGRNEWVNEASRERNGEEIKENENGSGYTVEGERNEKRWRFS